MPEILRSLRCQNCDGALDYKAGEVITTCPYCGNTQVVEMGKPFMFEHSMLPLKIEIDAVEPVVRSWMRKGFLKRADLHRKAELTSQQLRLLPFWVVEVKAITAYEGIFDRVSPAYVKQDNLEKSYNWLILARRRAGFPTKEFDFPAAGTQPYDFRRVPEYAEVINAQLTKEEAVEQVQQEVEEHHRHLISNDVDRIVKIHTAFTIGETQYVHAPVWYIKYKYKRKNYTVLLGGHRGIVIAGEFPRD
jgi:hypothetical protein